MDACEHEYESMSRHNRKVPTSFYHRFARDARALSDKYAIGRLVSVLEGGYSDRALMSGAMAHLTGLVDEHQLSQGEINEAWWNVENLIKVRCFASSYAGSVYIITISILARESDEETTRRPVVSNSHSRCK